MSTAPGPDNTGLARRGRFEAGRHGNPARMSDRQRKQLLRNENSCRLEIGPRVGAPTGDTYPSYAPRHLALFCSSARHSRRKPGNHNPTNLGLSHALSVGVGTSGG